MEPAGSLTLSSLTSLFGIAMLLASAFVLWMNTRTVRRTDLNQTSEEWRKNSEAYEGRVKVLEIRDTDRARELFDMSVRLEDVERTNKRIGRHNLTLQRQVDSLQRREKQLVTALRTAGIPVPEAEQEEEE